MAARRVQEESQRRTAAAYSEARAGLDRLDRSELSRLHEWLDAETGRVTTLLGREFKGKLREKFLPQYLVPLRGRLEAHFEGVGRRLEGKLRESTGAVLLGGARAAERVVGRLDGRTLPEGLAEQVRVKHEAELQRLRADSARGLGRELGSETWHRLRASFEAQTRVSDMVALSGELLDNQAWRVERLVRTELSYGYNLAQAAALRALPLEPGELIFGRWTERVDDATGAPLDLRVAQDSLVLHGQVTRPGGVFTMPADPRAPARSWGRSWAHPPNRPNDRAVFLPWRRVWGVGGWLLQGGRRIEL